MIIIITILITNNFENIHILEGFNCIESNDSRGVCIFYKNNLEITVHDKINDIFNPSFFINVKTESKPLNIGHIYRSPNSEERGNKKVNNQISFASKKLNHLKIFGDFNHPSIDREHTYCKRSEDHCYSQFLIEIIRLNLNQLITATTHHKPNCKPSLIDLVPETIINVTHNPPIAKSHHQVITAKTITAIHLSL
jgi:hypothetical protein